MSPAAADGRRHITLPITGGMWPIGDPTTMPEDATRLVRNMMFRPGPRIDSRPPFTYDGLLNVTGLFTWEDLANQVTRFGALDSSNRIFLKSTTDETWTLIGGLNAPGTRRMTSFCSYRGVLYLTFDDGAGNPIAVATYDGMNLVSCDLDHDPFLPTDRPFNSFITCRQIVPYIDRLFLIGPRLKIAPYNGGGPLTPTTTAYDWTDPVTWTSVNVTARMMTLGTGVQTCRLTPTSMGVKACYIEGPTGLLSFSPSTSAFQFVCRGELRGVDATYGVPVTLELVLSVPPAPNTTYTVGDLITSGDYAYRCIVGGLSAAIAPTYGTTVSGTTVDGAVTWVNVGSKILASSEATNQPFSSVPPISAEPTFTEVYLPCTIPPRTNTVTLTTRLKFWNSSATALTQLVPIDISFKDGKLDSDPSKANHGWQWTIGDFFYLFFNKEDAITRTIDLESIMWSETSQPRVIRAVNTYQPKEAAGIPTAGRVVNGRLVVWKRRAFWTFNGTDDPDNPILPEGPAQLGIGCVGSLAHDALDDEVMFIDEKETYRYRIGGSPLPICGDAMRETVMNRTGASWIEKQPTYNLPLLSIDLANREALIYTQRGTVYVYHDMLNRLPASTALALNQQHQGMWGTIDVGQQALNVAAMAFNPVTAKMEIAFGGRGLARLDPTVTNTNDTIDAGAAVASSCEIVMRPIELFAPRVDAIIDEIAAFHLATAAQAGTLTFGLSFDRGATWTKYDKVTIPLTNPRIPVALFQFGNSLTMRLLYEGPLGASVFALSKCEAVVQMLGEELGIVLPSQQGSIL